MGKSPSQFGEKESNLESRDARGVNALGRASLNGRQKVKNCISPD